MAHKAAYKKDQNGCMTETNASIKRHVSEEFGFKVDSIVLCEASFRSIEIRDKRFTYCTQVDFMVNGRGFSTVGCFDEVVRNHAFDRKA